MGEPGIVRVGLDRLDQLVELWQRLHQYQASVAGPVEGVELRSAGPRPS